MGASDSKPMTLGEHKEEQERRRGVLQQSGTAASGPLAHSPLARKPAAAQQAETKDIKEAPEPAAQLDAAVVIKEAHKLKHYVLTDEARTDKDKQGPDKTLEQLYRAGQKLVKAKQVQIYTGRGVLIENDKDFEAFKQRLSDEGKRTPVLIVKPLIDEKPPNKSTAASARKGKGSRPEVKFDAKKGVHGNAVTHAFSVDEYEQSGTQHALGSKKALSDIRTFQRSVGKGVMNAFYDGNKEKTKCAALWFRTLAHEHRESHVAMAAAIMLEIAKTKQDGTLEHPDLSAIIYAMGFNVKHNFCSLMCEEARKNQAKASWRTSYDVKSFATQTESYLSFRKANQEPASRWALFPGV
jgi:hypothetical protein